MFYASFDWFGILNINTKQSYGVPAGLHEKGAFLAENQPEMPLNVIIMSVRLGKMIQFTRP
jgi:hypothetical protein